MAIMIIMRPKCGIQIEMHVSQTSYIHELTGIVCNW